MNSGLHDSRSITLNNWAFPSLVQSYYVLSYLKGKRALTKFSPLSADFFLPLFWHDNKCGFQYLRPVWVKGGNLCTTVVLHRMAIQALLHDNNTLSTNVFQCPEWEKIPRRSFLRTGPRERLTEKGREEQGLNQWGVGGRDPCASGIIWRGLNVDTPRVYKPLSWRPQESQERPSGGRLDHGSKK